MVHLMALTPISYQAPVRAHIARNHALLVFFICALTMVFQTQAESKSMGKLTREQIEHIHPDKRFWIYVGDLWRWLTSYYHPPANGDKCPVAMTCEIRHGQISNIRITEHSTPEADDNAMTTFKTAAQMTQNRSGELLKDYQGLVIAEFRFTNSVELISPVRTDNYPHP
jgi:hypothetical protein